MLDSTIDISTLFVEFHGTAGEFTKLTDEHKLYLRNHYITRYIKMRCLSYIGVLNGSSRPSPSKRNKSRKIVHFTGE